MFGGEGFPDSGLVFGEPRCSGSCLCGEYRDRVAFVGGRGSRCCWTPGAAIFQYLHGCNGLWQGLRVFETFFGLRSLVNAMNQAEMVALGCHRVRAGQSFVHSTRSDAESVYQFESAHG